MSKKRIIVTAANDSYYSLLVDLISSIEDSKGESDVAIGVLDIGLTDEQRGALSERVQCLVTPQWDYPISHLNFPARKFQAMASRPHLPRHFPGYDLIMWMDADTWIQQWRVVEHFFDRAEINGLAICQEMDRSYLNVYNMNNSRQIFHNSLRAFGDDVANRVIWMPMVNSGVFAMRADCPYWIQWRDILGAAIQRGHLNHLIEQTALNVCIYSRLPLPSFMPARFNWICVHALPAFNEDSSLYVEPSVPHDPIGIIHLAGRHTRFDAGMILDLQGNKTPMTLLYSQWKQYKDRFR